MPLSPPKMNFKHKLITGLAAASATLLLVAVLSYLSLVHNTVERQWVTHTRMVLEKLADVQINITDAETGERGYILTGNDAYLWPYEDGVSHVHQNIGEVRNLVSDNPRQLGALAQLEPLIDTRIGEFRDRIEIRRQQGLAAGIIAVRDISGKQTMDRIRTAIAEMKQDERRLLVQRTAELDANARRTRAIIVVGEGLGFLFLLAAGLVIQGEMRRRSSAEEAVRILNADLERKVEERTAELAERAKDLERSNLELQQFAYVASHDLQEPLRTISSFTQLLAKRYQDKLDDKAGEFIGFAVEGCKRMQTLINDLLAFSRVGTQGKPLVPVNCDVALDRILRSLKVAIEETGTVITRDALPNVLADEGQLCQLFQNLIGNAIKFRGSAPPRVHVSAERNGTRWKLSVRDNGIGISPEHRERIFVIFQRLHTRTKYPGTGIGLAVCKKIAERHGGGIWVEPGPDGGSIFCFTIADGELANAKERKTHELRISATAD
ncbi:MAG TPA: CHASE3 domain-containing protein [Candidatus Solibacter sp.]|nr:CHASE3 domain-containing protein [Candidatus Solibacter sp.]